jgi:hypothetical protein
LRVCIFQLAVIDKRNLRERVKTADQLRFVIGEHFACFGR